MEYLIYYWLVISLSYKENFAMVALNSVGEVTAETSKVIITEQHAPLQVTIVMSSLVLPAITISFKVEVYVQNSTLKRALEPLLMRVLPFFVYNSECL